MLCHIMIDCSGFAYVLHVFFQHFFAWIIFVACLLANTVNTAAYSMVVYIDTAWNINDDYTLFTNNHDNTDNTMFLRNSSHTDFGTTQPSYPEAKDKDVERMARKFKLDDPVTSRLTELKVPQNFHHGGDCEFTWLLCSNSSKVLYIYIDLYIYIYVYKYFCFFDIYIYIHIG